MPMMLGESFTINGTLRTREMIMETSLLLSSLISKVFSRGLSAKYFHLNFNSNLSHYLSRPGIANFGLNFRLKGDES